MKFSHLISALVGATAVWVFAKAKNSRGSVGVADLEMQTKYESHSDPRRPLGSTPSDNASRRNGSGLKDGYPRPSQTSDWYGHQPDGPTDSGQS